jgi:outer membrane protein assembly factor BamB
VPGTGVWTHQYGTAANAAYGGEELRGARGCGELSVQWVGRPGPRLQVDRFQRKPSPLSAGGRLFVQGLNRIVCVDAYNGVGLWSREMPAFMRFNVPRDCANWCADREHLFLAVDNRCVQLDARSGEVARTLEVVPPELGPDDPRRAWGWHWDYIGRQGPYLVGSATKAGSSYRWYAARGAWYDGRGLPQVCSDNLFVLDAATGKTRWAYSPWLVLSATITVSDDRVFLVEARAPGLVKTGSRRLSTGLWDKRFLVALDLASGETLWQTGLPAIGRAETSYLAFADDMLVLATSAGDKQYHVSGYSAADGKPAWTVPPFRAPASHGAHIKRPCIVDGRVMIRSQVFDLKTGELLGPMPGEGCGTISAARYAVIGRRQGSVSLWGVGDDESTLSTWRNLRPGCWLSTIPAAGMVLSPEGGAGCRCPRWIEISIAFKPRVDQAAFLTTGGEFFDRTEVGMAKPRGGGDIYYTVDGSAPTLTSRKYTGPIPLLASATIRARGATPGTRPRLGEEVSRVFERVRVDLPRAAKINFQPRGPVPEGWQADTGEFMGRRDSGQAFGWNARMSRSVGGKAQEGTPESTFATYRGSVEWEACVENGEYDVTLGVSGNVTSLKVEDVAFCKDFKAGGGVEKVTRRVAVKDHRLTLGTDTSGNQNIVGRVHYLTFAKR